MFKELLLSLGASAIVTTPVLAPARNYTVTNNTNSYVRATNLNTDEEFYLAPGSVFNTINSPSSYAFDANTPDYPGEYYFAFSYGDTLVIRDVDYSDSYYYTPTGQYDLTIYNASYSDTVYMDFNTVPTEPFEDKFQSFWGVNASTYAGLGTSILTKFVEVVEYNIGTTFNLYWNNYTTLNAKYNINYSTIVARLRLVLKDGQYTQSNVRAFVDFIAINKNLAGANRYAVILGGNYEGVETTLGPLTTFKYGGVDYSCDGIVNGNIGAYRNFFGLDNRLVNMRTTITNAKQLGFLTYQTTVNPAITNTDTTVILDDFFTLIGKAFKTMFPFLTVMVFPGITIGLLIMIPLFITLIIAIFKLLKK